jgi:hypothetical protein
VYRFLGIVQLTVLGNFTACCNFERASFDFCGLKTGHLVTVWQIQTGPWATLLLMGHRIAHEQDFPA